MLSFMRRYQRLFFVIITAVIVISFSFFGTYQNLFQQSPKGETAFTAVNGKRISQKELTQMALFLTTESGVAWGNPLNDGVLSHDILESGLGTLLASYYQEVLEEELSGKGAHEALYTPYRHPYAPMLGAEMIWSSFAPEIKEGVEALKADLPFEERFAKRAHLFLAEQHFPQNSLKQMVRYQEGQLNGLPQDRELGQRDLSLFGYHTLEDWFGRSFISLAAQTIINASILAEQRGYLVSKKEAWADLVHNAELAATRPPTLYSGSGSEALDAILRRSGITPAEATQIWQRVLLFRRLFQDTGSTPLIDTLPFDRLSEYAGETLPIVTYTLPGKINLKNGDDLLGFESYLDAVYDRNREDLAALPTKGRPIGEIKQRAPELVYREYPLRIKEVNRETLGANIPIKEIWNWQLQDPNWDTLETRIPSLGKQEGERFARLKALDKMSRERADTMARQAILKAHPERVFTALAIEEGRQETLKIPYAGKSPLKGVVPAHLMEKLEKEEGPVIFAGEETTYEVTLLAPPSEDRAFLYPEAKVTGALRELADRRIEKGYQKRSDKSKPLSQVRDEVIAALVQGISKEVHSKTEGEARPDDPTPEYAAKMRFVPHMQRIKEERKDEEMTLEDQITVHASDPLASQWEVERSTSRISRSQSLPDYSFEELTEGMVSTVHLNTSRGVTFFKVGAKEKGSFDNPLQYDQMQKALSYEAQKQLFAQVMEEIEAQGGMETIQEEEE